MIISKYIELSLTHVEFLIRVQQCQNWPCTLSKEEKVFFVWLADAKLHIGILLY